MSDLEAAMLLHIRNNGLPEPKCEYRFHPKRKWRFDMAWLDRRVALEVEGGVWLQTTTGRGKGHAHPKRFADDCEKYNEAALLGWKVLRVTGEQIHDGSAADWLRRALIEQGGEKPPF